MDLDRIIKELTLEEKASLCSGEDFWHTKAIERLGIGSVLVSDGPNGLRLQEGEADHLGIHESVKAVCFPTSSAVAASFDTKLAEKIGTLLGKECRALGVSMLLGPGVNIKRSPLCGRNFEYYSEDPYLSGKMGAAFIRGVEEQNIGACVKHFAANNQETRRLTGNSVVDERTLHEIYLSGFETCVKEGRPAGVMCAYNRINGVFAAENRELLTDILRDRWGYEGMVVTDWGAVKDRVKGIAAGLDLEMPGSDSSKRNDRKIVEAVQSGQLTEEQLDLSVKRILAFLASVAENERGASEIDLEGDYREALEAAKECAVLLKNEGNLLPLEKGSRIAFVGGFVEKPRSQGSGSSHINSAKLPSIKDLIAGEKEIAYAKGFSLEDEAEDPTLVEEAVRLAGQCDAAVIFAGLPNRFETEGMDRTHMELPENQNKLIRQILEVQPNVAVVLHNGSPVAMSWAEDVKAILEMYLAGDGVSEAAMSLLYGEANPCGKLAETFPLQVSDNPSFLNFPGEDGVAEYHEGIFVGYRYYEKKKQKVLFPFGHGLSYTSFAYSDLRLSRKEAKTSDRIKVSLRVRNIGNRAGKEVVQLYVGQRDSEVRRPVKELRGFEKVGLEPGEEKEVSFLLDDRAFSYYETKIHDFYAPSETYIISAGSSSADIRLEEEIRFTAESYLPMEITLDTTIGELYAHPKLRPVIEAFMKQIYENAVEDAESGANQASIESMGEGAAQMGDSMIMGMSFGSILTFGAMTEEQVADMMEMFRKSL